MHIAMLVDAVDPLVVFLVLGIGIVDLLGIVILIHIGVRQRGEGFRFLRQCGAGAQQKYERPVHLTIDSNKHVAYLSNGILTIGGNPPIGPQKC